MNLFKYSQFILEYKKRTRPGLILEDFADLYVDKIAKEFKTSIVKKLGVGSFGIAYLTRNNKVLKVTTDQNEARNAMVLKDKKLKHFLNYYGVFEMTLDKDKLDYMEPRDIVFSDKKSPVFFLLMDYVKPLEGWKREIFKKYQDSIFNKFHKEKYFLKSLKWSISFKKFIKGYENYANDGLNKKGLEKIKEFFNEKVKPYFVDFIKNQREEMLKEGEEIGIFFRDAHVNNLGERKNGTIVYFDVGFSDIVRDLENKKEYSPEDIERLDFENDFKKIKNMIITKYKEGEPILVKKVVEDISKLLNINKVKAYKYLRDEVWTYYKKGNGMFGKKKILPEKRPLYFSYKPKDLTWEEFNKIEDEKEKNFEPRMKKRSGEILPIWKKDGNNEIFFTWTKGYKEKNIIN